MLQQDLRDEQSLILKLEATRGRFEGVSDEASGLTGNVLSQGSGLFFRQSVPVQTTEGWLSQPRQEEFRGFVLDASEYCGCDTM